MLPTVVDDIGVRDGIVIKQTHTLPQGLAEMDCCYAIVWEKRDGIASPVVMRGAHQFLNASKQYTFGPNQGYVGRISEAFHPMDHEMISNMFCIDPRAFLRKQAALLSGISSVLFISQSAGVVLEMGFSRPHAAESSLPLLLTSHALAMEQCILSEKIGRLCLSSASRNSIAALRKQSPSAQLRTRSPSAALRTRSPSPEYAHNDSWWPTIGSKGHPLCCQSPCKYVRKRRGCKDGLNCTRCHLCYFTKSGAKNSFNLENEFKAHTLATTLSSLGMAPPDNLGAA